MELKTDQLISASALFHWYQLTASEGDQSGSRMYSVLYTVQQTMMTAGVAATASCSCQEMEGKSQDLLNLNPTSQT